MLHDDCKRIDRYIIWYSSGSSQVNTINCEYQGWDGELDDWWKLFERTWCWSHTVWVDGILSHRSSSHVLQHASISTWFGTRQILMSWYLRQLPRFMLRITLIEMVRVAASDFPTCIPSVSSWFHVGCTWTGCLMCKLIGSIGQLCLNHNLKADHSFIFAAVHKSYSLIGTLWISKCLVRQWIRAVVLFHKLIS